MVETTAHQAQQAVIGLIFRKFTKSRDISLTLRPLKLNTCYPIKGTNDQIMERFTCINATEPVPSWLDEIWLNLVFILHNSSVAECVN